MKKIILLIFGVVIAITSLCQVNGNFKSIRLINADGTQGTLNGTIYYDLGSNSFQFRQDGAWYTLSSLTTASNGLNKVGNDIRSGGAYTQNTDYTGAFNIRFGTTGLNRLSTFQVNTTGNISLTPDAGSGGSLSLDGSTINIGANTSTLTMNPITTQFTGTDVNVTPSGTFLVDEGVHDFSVGNSGIKWTFGSDATGDIWYRNSSGYLSRLGVGSNGQVLTLSSGLPSWQTTASVSAATGSEILTGTDNTEFVSPLGYATASKKYFNVRIYGARGDGQLVSNGTITSGTAILTSASNPFTSSDVGKYIKVAGAGAAGVDLVTTILSFQSSSQVTLNTNASTTVSGTADVLWGTDCTTPIQNAIAAANTTQHGIVYFPWDVTGRYIVAGALVTSVEGGANPNSQLWIPKSSISDGVWKSIKFLGEVPPNGMFGGNNNTTIGDIGIVMESTILGSGTAPSVFGCSYNTSGAGGVINFTHTRVDFENICVRVRSKTGSTHIAPTMTAFDMSKSAQGSFVNCRAFTQSKLVSESVIPVDNTVAGFKFPARLNTNIINYSDQIYACGFYKGFILNDHAVVGFCGSAATVVGVEFPTSDLLGIHVKRYYCEGAIRPIEVSGNTSLIIEDFNFDDNSASWVVLDKIFNRTGGTDITGYIRYRFNIASFSSTNDFPNTFSFINTRDSSYPIQDLASSTGFSSLTVRIPTTSTNAGRGLSIMPKGTGTSATLKSQFDIFNTDFQSDQTNYERLLLRAAGTDGYVIDAQAAGTGTLRDIFLKYNGTTKLQIGNTAVSVGEASTTVDVVGGTLNMGNASTAGSSRNITALGSSSDLDLIFTNKGLARKFQFNTTSGSAILDAGGAASAMIIYGGSSGAVTVGGSTSLAGVIVDGVTSSEVTMYSTNSSNFKLGSQDITTSNTGDVSILTGNSSFTNGSSGNIFLQTGTKNGTGTRGNFSIFNTTGSFGSGQQVIFLNDATAVSSTAPTGGVIIESASGVFKWRDPSNNSWDMRTVSGTYTPTLTNVANLDGSTAYECQYMRVGNTVTVSGKVDINPTLATTSTQLGISLPIASNIGANEDCSGTAAASGVAGQVSAILGDATNDRAQLQYISGDVTDQPMYFSFTYQIL